MNPQEPVDDIAAWLTDRARFEPPFTRARLLQAADELSRLRANNDRLAHAVDVAEATHNRVASIGEGSSYAAQIKLAEAISPLTVAIIDVRAALDVRSPEPPTPEEQK